jgi:2-oxoisovalerate dehydrogenase E1 component alpha subunit
MGVVRDGAVGTGDGDRDTAVLAFFGDGASSQGDVNESFVFAAAGNLPVVFFCQNNQWAISEPVTTQSRVPLYQRASGFGFPGVRIDGNDVLASLAVTRKALDDARNAQGPTLIEAFTYRMNPHTTNDDPRRYRLGSEAETWKLKDPIERVRAYLARHVGLRHAFFDDLEAESKALAEHIRAGARALPNPTPESVFDHVHVDMPDELRAQRTEFADFVSSLEGA